MNGPASKRAVNPGPFVDYITSLESYRMDDRAPRRRRLCINGIPVSETDARMIRRWRTGKIEGITVEAAAALLRRYDKTPFQFAAWCATLHVAPTIRGSLRDDD
jgi:hypothetical protein